MLFSMKVITSLGVTMTKNFGRILKKLRLAYGISQNELSKRVDLTSSCISQMESNIRTPSFETMQKLQKFFKCSYDVLFGQKEIYAPEVINSLEGLTEGQQKVIFSLIDEFKKI